MDIINDAGIDDTYATYVDDECFAIHDKDDDADHDTDGNTEDGADDDTYDDTDNDTDDQKFPAAAAVNMFGANRKLRNQTANREPGSVNREPVGTGTGMNRNRSEPEPVWTVLYSTVQYCTVLYSTFYSL